MSSGYGLTEEKTLISPNNAILDFNTIEMEFFDRSIRFRD